MNIAYIFDHSDPVLLVTFALLIMMSVASWYVIFWKMLVLRVERKQLKSYNAGTTTVKGSVGVLLRKAKELESAGANPQERQQLLTMHLSQELDTVRVWLDRGLTILASVGSSAPFIGLFGTVWGIYNTLIDLSTKSGASLAVVAGPMGEALAATAAGLFAAIPAVLAYNAFVRSNRVLVQKLRHIAEKLTLSS